MHNPSVNKPEKEDYSKQHFSPFHNVLYHPENEFQISWHTFIYKLKMLSIHFTLYHIILTFNDPEKKEEKRKMLVTRPSKRRYFNTLWEAEKKLIQAFSPEYFLHFKRQKPSFWQHLSSAECSQFSLAAILSF